MKKILLMSLVIVSTVGITSKTARAARVTGLTEIVIHGVVTNAGQPVAGAPVAFNCAGANRGGTHTGPDGSYSAVVTCKLAAGIEVRASLPGPHASFDSGAWVIAKENTQIDIKIGVDRATVPEFGWIGGIVATGTGAGAVVFARRRYAGQGAGYR